MSGLVHAVHGQGAVAWLRDLPARAESLMEEWELAGLGDPFPGARAAWVAPAWTRGGRAVVLKIVPDPAWITHEAAALAFWSGRGAVELIAVDERRGAILLERVVPGTALHRQCSSDDRQATAAAASVIIELRSVRGGSDIALPDLSSWTAALRPEAVQRGSPALRQAAARALSMGNDLLDGEAGVLLHGDLHQYNVLQAERAPWLAVDPKGLLGPPAADAAALLRNPRRFVLSHDSPGRLLADRLAVLSEYLGDDSHQMASWGYVLAVVAGAWALEDGAGANDIERWLACADLLWKLVQERNAA